MQSLDHALFLWLNAPAHPNPATLALAVFLGERLVWAIPALIAVGWLRGGEHTRKAMIAATAAALLGLLANLLIGSVWPHPRPFAIGLGHALIAHAANSSFPSDHLTLWWAVAFSLLMQPRTRGPGAVLALAGLAVAWARIYLGVHFPLDMLGAAAVAACSAWLVRRAAPRCLEQVYRQTIELHRRLFARLIALGWVRD